MKDDEMLKKWLSDKEEKAFENGVKFASEKIFNLCNAMSMPVCFSSKTDERRMKEINDMFDDLLKDL